MEKTQIEKMFSTPLTVDDTSLAEGLPTEQLLPKIGCLGWSDYLLSKLTQEEKINDDKGNSWPKTSGLRRLVYEYLGEIQESISKVIEVPNESNGWTAVVEHCLVVHFYDDSKRVFQGVGDSSKSNTDPVYRQYPTAIASTRAAGRAYKDALSINTTVIEELSRVADMDAENELLTSTQKAALTMMCKKLNIDLNKFINMGKLHYGCVDDIPKSKSTSMIGLLNTYQQGLDKIPENIKLS